jgi:hypothetical protein
MDASFLSRVIPAFVLLLGAAAVRADLPAIDARELWRSSAFGSELVTAWRDGREVAAGVAVPRSPRIRLSRIMPGLLTENTPAESFWEGAVDQSAAGLRGTETSTLQVLVHSDNPFFDLRWPGELGGPGYYRVESALKLLELGNTHLCLGLLAFAPAGRDVGGDPDAPSRLLPSVAFFQDLGNGAALQGFVGQNVFSDGRLSGATGGPLEYGLAVQCPLPWFDFKQGRGIFVFVQTLGRLQHDYDRLIGKAPNWELVPGIHWRFGESGWFSLGASRTTLFTCFWKF